MNMNRLTLSVFWIFLTLASLPALFAQESNWPRTVPLGQGMVTIYSPQIDEMSEDIIEFRAALAYRATAGSEPVFGAGWFESPVTIDATNRIVRPTGLTLTEMRFPEGTADIQSELASVVASQSPAWNLDFSVDELDTALKAAETETRAVNTTPPRVVYRDHPALLITIDGEPVLREVENSPLKAVINTPYPLIFDGKYYYLNAAKDVWYRSRKVTGPYLFEKTPPKAIAAMVNPDDEVGTNEEPVEPITAANAPEIVISTEPAELIVTEGPAAFVPLVDDLLVLQNSDDDVFMHVSSQQFYIVLAGRWYHSNSLNGPWAYQPADDLPKAFADIPRDSNQADSRVYVAGTEEAKDAVLDAQIPQTAAVSRGEVDIEVKYDGAPVYQPVDGTDLVYIQNTGSTVIVSGGLYYLVEEGVWYVSSSSNGPWQVSDHRPAQVDTILPTSPVYNSKYVYVYDSTPDVVYVGYTPGYTGSYVYRNTIFYGTGWYYRPWVSPYYYYPRFSTWGFNVGYNPWNGWNFGLSWGWGPFNVAYYSGGYWHRNHYWYHNHHGRWGPGRYRYRYGHRPVHYGYGRDRYASNGYRRNGDYGHDGGRNNGGRYDNGRDRRGNSRLRGNEQNYNLYRDSSQRARIAGTRDKQPRATNRYAVDGRRVNSINADGRRVQRYAGKNKAERNRPGPVSASELRTKARVRDVNIEANRNRLLADNNGQVYQKADRKKNRSSRLGGVGSEKRSTNLASVQSTRSNSTGNRGAWQSSSVDQKPARRSQRNTSDKWQSTTASDKATGRQSRAKSTGYAAKQRSPSAAKAPRRASQPRAAANNTRKQTRLAAQAPVRQARQATVKNTSRQQPAQRNSAPVYRQNRSGPPARPSGSKDGAAKNSAAVRESARNDQQKSSQRRGGTKSSSDGSQRKSRGRSGGK